MPPILARDLVPGPAPHQLSLVKQSRDAAVPETTELDGLSPVKQSRGAAVHEPSELDGTHQALACQALDPAKQSQGPGTQAEPPRGQSSLTVRIELWRRDSCSTSSPLHSTSSASTLSAASRPSGSARHIPDCAPERLSSAPQVDNHGTTIASLASSSPLSQNSELQHPKLARRSFVTTVQGFMRTLSAPKGTSSREDVSPFLQQSRPPRARDLSFWGKR